MKNIVYLSTAIKLLGDNELIEILDAARKNNVEYHVSGVLLYSEGTFIQLIEGDDADVDFIYAKIKQDNRHKNIIALIDSPIQERNFSDWLMGFASLKADKVNDVIGYLKSSGSLNAKKGNSAAATTLKTFIDTNNLQISY